MPFFTGPETFEQYLSRSMEVLIEDTLMEIETAVDKTCKLEITASHYNVLSVSEIFSFWENWDYIFIIANDLGDYQGVYGRTFLWISHNLLARINLITQECIRPLYTVW